MSETALDSPQLESPLPEGPGSANGELDESDDDFQYEEVEVARYQCAAGGIMQQLCHHTAIRD